MGLICSVSISLPIVFKRFLKHVLHLTFGIL